MFNVAFVTQRDQRAVRSGQHQSAAWTGGRECVRLAERDGMHGVRAASLGLRTRLVCYEFAPVRERCDALESRALDDKPGLAEGHPGRRTRGTGGNLASRPGLVRTARKQDQCDYADDDPIHPCLAGWARSEEHTSELQSREKL